MLDLKRPDRYPKYRIPYPNASVLIDAQESITCELCIFQTLEETALMWRQLADDLMWGRWEKVEALPFTGRIYKGTCYPRGSILPSVRTRIISQPCIACGRKDNIEVDHIYPVSRGGGDGESNLQPLCTLCNRAKGVMTMKEWSNA